MRVVVVERIVPGTLPSCLPYARATCMGHCDEWVWLGKGTLALVNEGVQPLCVECAAVIIRPETAVFLEFPGADDMVTDP